MSHAAGSLFTMILAGASKPVRYTLALSGVAAMSAVIGSVLSVVAIANLATLYLIVVLAAATRLGRGPASASAWFFRDQATTEPR